MRPCPPYVSATEFRLILIHHFLGGNMMSRYRRSLHAGGTYFFTVVTYRRQTMLCDDMMRSALRSAIESVRSTRPFAIDAWVLLPDHLHCIWTLPEGDTDFSTRWMMIKRKVSLACATDYRRSDLLTASKQTHQSFHKISTL